MWRILAGCALSLAACVILVRIAWRDHYAHLDAFEVIARQMNREHRARIRRAIRAVRRSRRAGTMDDVVWFRELDK